MDQYDLLSEDEQRRVLEYANGISKFSVFLLGGTVGGIFVFAFLFILHVFNLA